MQLRNNYEGKNRWIILWLLTGCFLIYIMVMVGGITRLTNSGLSMVEWSAAGNLPPLNQTEWLGQYEKYKQSPEYKFVNYNFSLSDFKKIFWWEYIHRFIGRAIGVIFIVPFFYFLTTKKIPKGFVKKVVFLFFLGVVQGLVGWFMVKSGLIKNPHVSHYRLALHLITALTLLGFTFWFALNLLYPEKEKIGNQLLRKSIVAFLCLTLVQIIYGAFVAGLKAGYLYSSFPKMGDFWIPKETFGLVPIWKNFFENHACVQLIHRGVAYLLILFAVFIFFFSKKNHLTKLQSKIFTAMLLIVGGQFILGVLTIIYHVPVAIAIMHQAGAFFLFGISLFLIHRLR